MQTFQETLDLLRGRFLRLRAGHTFDVLASLVGLSARALQTFARGEAVSDATIRKIEAWCEQCEAKGQEHGRRS